MAVNLSVQELIDTCEWYRGEIRRYEASLAEARKTLSNAVEMGMDYCAGITVETL